jgi:hypothetical protein
MGSERFWKMVWAIAVWHNLIGGVGLIFFGDYLYLREGLEPPSPGVNYVRWWLLILVFALAYYMVYHDLYHSRNLVITGIFGKLASATSDLFYLTMRSGVPKIFWTTVCTDYAFIIMFVLFLRFLAKHSERAKST